MKSPLIASLALSTALATSALAADLGDTRTPIKLAIGERSGQHVSTGHLCSVLR